MSVSLRRCTSVLTLQVTEEEKGTASCLPTARAQCTFKCFTFTFKSTLWQLWQNVHSCTHTHSHSDKKSEMIYSRNATDRQEMKWASIVKKASVPSPFLSYPSLSVSLTFAPSSPAFSFSRQRKGRNGTRKQKEREREIEGETVKEVESGVERR